MIGWKCKYGYCTSPDFNINNLVYTDDSVFGIPTILPFAVDSKDVFYSDTSSTYKHECTGSSLESAFGKDYYFISMLFANTYINPNDNLNTINARVSFLSSIETIHPNLTQAFKSGDYPLTFAYIPSLHRYIVTPTNTSSTRTYAYDDEGNSAGSFLVALCRLRSPIGFWVYLGEPTKDQMIIPRNYAFIGISPTRSKYYTSSLSNEYSIDLQLFFNSFSPPDYDIPDNPYQPGGDSGEGGGGGSFDDNSDSIPDSSLPSISSANTGFTRIYNPTLSQVQDLARYLWTDESVVQTIWNHIKQFFENPMEAIIGFNLVPCAVPNGGTKNFALMYIDTGVPMTVAANQFVDVDCGTLEIKEYFGSALDYSPYTKISCFLPFIGTVQLNTDEVMKSTLQVKYRIDICSGSCVAKILVGGSVLYQYSGHCAIPIPISAADFSSYVSAAVSVAKLAIGAAVGGGMGALMAGADNPSQQTNQIVTTTQTTETGRNPATGRQITLGTKTTVETRESPADQSSTQASFSGIAASNISNTVGQIMTAKPHVEHSGSFSGNTGYLGVRRPYVIIQRPNMCMPQQYQQFNGFPSMITETLSSLKGFTRVQQVQLTEMSATNPEQAEILEFLKSGVII